MNFTKIILTRCQIFHLKCTKFNFGSASDPVAGAHTAPQTLAGFGRGRGKGGERRGKKQESKEGENGRRKGR